MVAQRGNRLVTNTLWMGLGQAIRSVVQAAYFVLIARALGAEAYGAFVGAVALVAIGAPFASWGSGNLLVKHVSRTPEAFATHWGKALLTTLVCGAALLVLSVPVASVFLPRSIPLGLVLAVGAGDLIFARLVDISAFAYQAMERMSRTAQVQLLASALRLLAACALVTLTDTPTAVQWSALYLSSSVMGGALAVALVCRELGKPRISWRALANEWREGAYFAVGLSAQTVYNDVDKAMLTRLATLEATGIYGAAYRLVDMAFLPIGALVGSTYARFFQHGAQGVRAAARFASRLAAAGVGYGVLVAGALYVAAPLLPLLLGPTFDSAVEAVRWLALLPVLKAIHYFGANALTGAGYQGLRTTVQVAIAALNVGLNLWLIPLYSWRGAAVASLASDGLLAIALWLAVWRLRRLERESWEKSNPGAVLGIP